MKRREEHCEVPEVDLFSLLRRMEQVLRSKLGRCVKMKIVFK